MYFHLTSLLDRIRGSLWLIPALLTCAAAALAIALPLLDAALVGTAVTELPLVYDGNAANARTVLATIAGATVTLAGTVFSMTLITLQLASTQFGPRLLRSFLRDRGNQLVLGSFGGIFLYCLLVMAHIEVDQKGGIPQLSITAGLAMAIAGLGMLVYFIDHVAQSIHADGVIAAVSRELHETIERLYPTRLTQPAEAPAADAWDDRVAEGSTVAATREGYIRYLDLDRVVQLARDHDALIELEVVPGDYVLEGAPLMRFAARHAEPPAPPARQERLERSLGSCITISSHRTSLQDVRFAFAQLVEMAVRALSPGVNDPTTARHCVDRITGGLCRLVARIQPDPFRRDADGAARLRTRLVGLESLLRDVVLPVARCAGPHLDVWLRLIALLRDASAAAVDAATRQPIEQLGRDVALRARARFDTEPELRQLAEASVAFAPALAMPGDDARRTTVQDLHEPSAAGAL